MVCLYVFGFSTLFAEIIIFEISMTNSIKICIPLSIPQYLIISSFKLSLVIPQEPSFKKLNFLPSLSVFC